MIQNPRAGTRFDRVYYMNAREYFVHGFRVPDLQACYCTRITVWSTSDGGRRDGYDIITGRHEALQ